MLAHEAPDLRGHDLERVDLPHGHWVARTHPEVVAAEVRRFVREHQTRG